MILLESLARKSAFCIVLIATNKVLQAKRNKTNEGKRRKITIKNPIISYSPVYYQTNSNAAMGDEIKGEKNILRELEKTLIDSSIKREINKDIKSSQQEGAQRKIEINMNILKCKLYNIDIINAMKSPVNKSIHSPFSKSHNNCYVDPNGKKIGNSLNESLKNAVLKPENFKRFMQQTHKVINYGENFNNSKMQESDSSKDIDFSAIFKNKIIDNSKVIVESRNRAQYKCKNAKSRNKKWSTSVTSNLGNLSKCKYVDLLKNGYSLRELNMRNEKRIWTYGLVGEKKNIYQAQQ